MRKLLLPSLLVSVLALAALCGPAAAAPPSSDASINDYEESAPGPGGGHSGDDQPSGGGGSGGSPLSPQTEEQLGAQGPSGEALTDFAEATGSAPGTAGDAAAGGQGGSDGAQGGSAGGSGDSKGAASTSGAGTGDGSGGFFNTVGDVFSAVLTGSEDDTGLGVGLPLLLGAALLGTAALLVLRRRRDEG